MTTEIFVRPVDDEDAAQIEDFTSLDVILRRRDVGSWSIEAPLSPEARALATPGAGIVVERDGQVLISGPMTQYDRSRDGDVAKLVISGLSDTRVLWDRLVYPGRARSVTPFLVLDDPADVRDGAAETVIREYVEANCISGQWARPVDGLTQSVDLGRGGQVIGRGRFQTVGEICQDMAVAGGGLGFSVDDMVFNTWMTVDRTDEVTFSEELGNVFSVDYMWAAPQATHALIAGGGEAVDRLYLARDEQAAARWGRRIEVFVDERSTTDSAEILQAGDKALTDNAEQVSITVKPIDLPDFMFGKHYGLDDLVAAEDQGVYVTGRIAQVEITLDENGETVQPSVDSSTSVAASLSLLTFDRIRKLQRRMSALERAL